MDLERFENNINDKFKNFEPSIDDSKIWDKIEGNLPKEKKRRPFWLFGLFLIPAVYFYIGLETETNLLKIQNELPEVSTIENQVETNQAFANVVSPEEKEEFDETTVNDNSPEGIRVQSAAGSMNIQETSPLKANNITSGLQKNKTFAQTKSITKTNSTSSVTKFAQAKKEEKNKKKLNQEKDEKAFLVAKREKEEESEDTVIEKTPSEKKVAVVESQISEQKDDAQLTIPATDYSVDNHEDQEDNQKQSEKLITKEFIEDAVQEKELKEKKGSIAFTTAIYLANRIYDQTSNDQLAQTIAEKETAEKQLETLQFSLEYKYRIAPKFSVGLGLRQWKLSEASTYSTARNYDSMIDVVTGIIHHYDGTTTELYSSIPIEITELVDNTRYQTHTSWSVPVKLYYALSSKKKIRTELAVGYEHSFSGKHEGYELDGINSEYFITQDIGDNYTDRGGNYLLADLHVEYLLKNAINLTAGLEGKYGLNGFNTESAEYKKKYHFLGLYAGLNYTF